jgi:hypothetical protein
MCDSSPSASSFSRSQRRDSSQVSVQATRQAPSSSAVSSRSSRSSATVRFGSSVMGPPPAASRAPRSSSVVSATEKVTPPTVLAPASTAAAISRPAAATSRTRTCSWWLTRYPSSRGSAPPSQRSSRHTVNTVVRTSCGSTPAAASAARTASIRAFASSSASPTSGWVPVQPTWSCAWSGSAHTTPLPLTLISPASATPASSTVTIEASHHRRAQPQRGDRDSCVPCVISSSPAQAFGPDRRDRSRTEALRGRAAIIAPPTRIWREAAVKGGAPPRRGVRGRRDPPPSPSAAPAPTRRSRRCTRCTAAPSAKSGRARSPDADTPCSSSYTSITFMSPKPRPQPATGQKRP